MKYFISAFFLNDGELFSYAESNIIATLSARMSNAQPWRFFYACLLCADIEPSVLHRLDYFLYFNAGKKQQVTVFSGVVT